MPVEGYEVTGQKKIFEVPPGGKFRRDIPDPQRSRLIGRGLITPCDLEVTESTSAEEVEVDEGEETVPTDVNPEQTSFGGLFKTSKEG